MELNSRRSQKQLRQCQARLGVEITADMVTDDMVIPGPLDLFSSSKVDGT